MVTNSDLIYNSQVLSLRMDKYVEESTTFNLKPLPQNVAANENLRQLECDVTVSQRSDQMSAVVIRAVHEIGVRPVHRVCALPV